MAFGRRLLAVGFRDADWAAEINTPTANSQEPLACLLVAARHEKRHHSMRKTCFAKDGDAMRTTVALDDALVAEAQALAGLKEKSALLREALQALIARESARRLAFLGRTQPKLAVPPRRRPDPA